MLIKTIAYCFFCICAGSAVSAGFVAFITMLGIFDKLAEQMKSGKVVHRIEALIIAGVTIGNAAYLFGLRIPIGLAGFSIFNLFGGIFIGCLAGALAETLQVMPILSRRLGVRTWLPYVMPRCHRKSTRLRLADSVFSFLNYSERSYLYESKAKRPGI